MSSPAPTLVPRPDPDWSGAAEVLIEGCAHLPTPEERVRWLERLCLSLGDTLYPAFLQVLCRVGEHGDAAAQKAVADTLVLALQTGRLPSGRHTAWGATHGAATRAMGPIEYLCAWHAQPDNRGPLAATAFDRAARAVLGLVSHSDTARRMYCAKLLADAEDPLGRHTAWGATHGAATRAMGPIEYLCAWHAQPDNRGPLAATAFDRAARAVLGLVSHSDTARRMYCAKLLADAEDPLGGAWSRGTRPALAAMARSWSAAGATTSAQRAAADAVDAFLAELRRSDGGGVAAVAAGWIPPASPR